MKLPVPDVGRSRDRYVQALGFAREVEFREEGRLRGVGLRHPEADLGLGLREDPARARAPADLDSVCLAVGTRADLDALLARLDTQGIQHTASVAGHRGDAADVPGPERARHPRPHPQLSEGTIMSSFTHVHDRHCYWDLTRCGWACPAPPPAPPVTEAKPGGTTSEPAEDADARTSAETVTS
ncbi:VOC family protein [Pseudonocardia sp. H11422]|uniref:VOC family protein n=1 Tax=Pseudonocardia sp. H11422 TaxID=2835866 RepID=UPI001BDD9AF6|nr:VOC family protein [Pseudonocardia sp. H11422]